LTEARLAALEAEIAKLKHENFVTRSRGDVENVFSRYHYLHNAFRDDLIREIWVKRGTPGMRAIYTNNGEYTDYDAIMEYHENRPTPKGKLILHQTTTPVIEVAADGKTAKGVWIMNGTEAGLTDPEHASALPDYLFSPQDVKGKKVWAHWVWAKYALDFLYQDGAWKILTFRCYEIARTPFEENWVAFASKNAEFFGLDVKYFGEGGEVFYMPSPNEPVKTKHWPYRNDLAQELSPNPPKPYDTFEETFR
jgi:hypothetical protein